MSYFGEQSPHRVSVADLQKTDSSHSTEIAERLNFRRGFIGIDLDKTIINRDYQITDVRIVDTIAKAQALGFGVGFHSDTPARSLRRWGIELVEMGKQRGVVLQPIGPNIAEMAIIDMPDLNVQIPIIEGVEEYFKDRRDELAKHILDDMPHVGLLVGDPVSLIRSKIKLPGELPFYVLLNGMSQVSIRMFTRQIRQDGTPILDFSFHGRVTDDLRSLLRRNPLAGIEFDWDVNPEYCLTIVKPTSLNKTRAYQLLLNLMPSSEGKTFHMIDDSPAGYIDDPRVQTWAVQNARPELSGKKGVKQVSGEYSAGVICAIERILKDA